MSVEGEHELCSRVDFCILIGGTCIHLSRVCAESHGIAHGNSFDLHTNYNITATTRGTVLYHTASLSVEWRALQHGPRPTTGDFGIIDQVRFVYHAAFDASMKNTRAPLTHY